MIQIADSTFIAHDSLALIPLGGQSEMGQLLWVMVFEGEIILVDAGAAYPNQDLPGVDLLLPNTNFLEANQDRIRALILTNGHEEHCGAVTYLLRHLKIPKIMAPKFVCQLLSQSIVGSPNPELSTQTKHQTIDNLLDTVEIGTTYEVGPFELEWIAVNNAIADSCALSVNTKEGTVIYTSSFKLDQTPVDGRVFDIKRLSQIGDKGVLALISDSAGVENTGYTPSEKAVKERLLREVSEAKGRVFVVFPGTNTHRLQILFDIAKATDKKMHLLGASLLKTALAAVVTGHLNYDRSVEASLEELNSIPDNKQIIVASGIEDDPMHVLHTLAYGTRPGISIRKGDTIIYSANIIPGKLRHFASILDQLLTIGVRCIQSENGSVHVSKHASAEELKLMLSLIKPKFFLPAIGEGRHIMHHAQLAIDWGMDHEDVFPIGNGDVLQIKLQTPNLIGSVDAGSVLYNWQQGERVTTSSVRERKNLSYEGAMVVSLVLDETFQLIQKPSIQCRASGFLKSNDWIAMQNDLNEVIVKALEAAFNTQKKDKEINTTTIKTAVREAVVRLIKQRLQTKPYIQVMVHQLSEAKLKTDSLTNRPQWI